MLIKIKRGWELPESAATPEAIFRDRRRILKAAAAGPILLAGAGGLGRLARAAEGESSDPSASLYPVERNLTYKLDRELTDEEIVTTYNNYYEFGSSKNIWRDAQELPIRPWTVQIAGMVEQEFEIGIDELLAKMPLEERLYRHRCVEAWSITVPWSGFAMRPLVELAKPTSGAKYIKTVSFEDSDVASGQRASWYPWPYIEGVSMAEAMNDLAFLGTGAYGKPMPKQNGAPLRLVLPWKYGFKSAKGLVRFEFTDQQPLSFWEEIAANEYGFWANVNPEVDHPRWSQASERVLGTDERVPTQLYNGYEEYVAELYKDMQDNDRLFM
ncbi:MAG: protein-methionine-sulfoxide reductase catalytic subunit MsrP [Rhodovibrionaceae bacterium]